MIYVKQQWIDHVFLINLGKNTDENKWTYKKQRNLCVKLLKRAKKDFL